MLVFSPIVLSLSVYMGLMYSYFYLMITTLTPTFENIYHFHRNIVGLCYLGLGLGYLMGQILFAKLSDRILKTKATTIESGKAEMKPEYRLPLAVIGGFTIPVAFLWFGWSAQKIAPWILPIIGPAFLGFGNSLIFVRRVSSKQCHCFHPLTMNICLSKHILSMRTPFMLPQLSPQQPFCDQSWLH